MKFHVVSLPHTHTTPEFASCAFTQKVVRFCNMMKARGHEVILYAGEKNTANCDEHVKCVTPEDRIIMLEGKHYTESNWSHPLWDAYNSKVIEEMGSRLEKTDFICLIGGSSQKAIADAFPDNLSVEFGIGYAGTFAKYRVFESYAWMHMIYGADSYRNASSVDGNWYDAVIPNQVDEVQIFHAHAEGLDKFDEDSPITADAVLAISGHMGANGEGLKPTVEDQIEHLQGIKRKVEIHNMAVEPYYLYVGRLIDRKGYKIAQDVCEKLGKRLILAGPGKASGYGEFIGEINEAERNYLMKRAIAMFVPTQYIEPFGTVSIEAMSNGCPVITSDWGAFTETVKGDDGWRCRMFKDFLMAANLAERQFSDKERRKARSERGLARFSMETVSRIYEDYFKRLSTLHGVGWYSLD